MKRTFKILTVFISILSSITMSAKTSYIFYADGVEEVEAVATVDALRRAGMEVVTVSINDTPLVTGATNQKLVADSVLSEIDASGAEWIIIPGGDPGATNLHNNAKVNDIIMAQYDKGGKIAAICAAPAQVLAPLGILKGRKATCHPGVAQALKDAGVTYEKQPVVIDGNFVTSEGPGTTFSFAKGIISETYGAEKAAEVISSLVVE